MQWACPHSNILTGKLIASIGFNQPTGLFFLPFHVTDLGMKQCIIIKLVLPPNPLALLKNFRPMSILFSWHVSCFLKKRHIHKRGSIALRTGITVPIPSTTKVTAFFEYSNIINTRLNQPGTGNQPGKPASNKSESDMVHHRVTRSDRNIRVLKVVGQLILDLNILPVAL